MQCLEIAICQFEFWRQKSTFENIGIIGTNMIFFLEANKGNF